MPLAGAFLNPSHCHCHSPAFKVRALTFLWTVTEGVISAMDELESAVRHALAKKPQAPQPNTATSVALDAAAATPAVPASDTSNGCTLGSPPSPPPSQPVPTSAEGTTSAVVPGQNAQYDRRSYSGISVCMADAAVLVGASVLTEVPSAADGGCPVGSSTLLPVRRSGNSVLATSLSVLEKQHQEDKAEEVGRQQPLDQQSGVRIQRQEQPGCDVNFVAAQLCRMGWMRPVLEVRAVGVGAQVGKEGRRRGAVHERNSVATYAGICSGIF